MLGRRERLPGGGSRSPRGRGPRGICRTSYEQEQVCTPRRIVAYVLERFVEEGGCGHEVVLESHRSLSERARSRPVSLGC